MVLQASFARPFRRYTYSIITLAPPSGVALLRFLHRIDRDSIASSALQCADHEGTASAALGLYTSLLIPVAGHQGAAVGAVPGIRGPLLLFFLHGRILLPLFMMGAFAVRTGTRVSPRLRRS